MKRTKLSSMLMLVAVAIAGLMFVGCGNPEQPAATSTPPVATTPGTATTTTTTSTTPASPAAATPSGAPAKGSPAASPAGSPAAGAADLDKLPGAAKWKGKKNPVASSPESIAKGKEIFTKNCATCHGDSGKGDGPAGVALDPKPRDFTAGDFKYGNDDSNLMRTIMEGVPNTGMAAWDGRMDEKDAWTVIHYVKSLKGK